MHETPGPIGVAALAVGLLAGGQAQALEADDVAALLSQVPSEVLNFESQRFDPDTGVTLSGVTLMLPQFGRVTVEELQISDLDIDGLMRDVPTYLDIAATGLSIARADYVGAMPWLFGSDVLTGTVAVSFDYGGGQPAYVGGSLLIDFGENGRLASEVSLAEPAWYPAPGPEGRLPDPSQRMLPLAWTFELDDVALAGDALTALSDGAWRGGDVGLAATASYFVDAEDDSLELTLGLRSNLAELELSAAGAYGALMRQEFADSYGPFIVLIDWSQASLSYRDAGLADAVLAAGFTAADESPFSFLAEALEELHEGSMEVGTDGPTRNAFEAMRAILLNYGSYAGDEITAAVRPVVPVSIAVIDDVHVDPDGGLHPDDLLRLLRARFEYTPN